MGIALGLSAALWFASSSVLVRYGMRRRPNDDGLFMTVLVNVLFLGVIVLFQSKPSWSTAGVAALAGAGVVGSVGGRASNLRAIRLIGASRSSAFITGTPVVAAIAGWVVLDEQLGVVDALGGAITIGGLLLLVRARSSAVSLSPSVETGRMVGYVFAAAAPTFFGLAFVLRKWGLALLPGAVLGAFIGAAAAFAFIVLLDTGSGRITERIRDNLRDIPWPFVGAGVTTGLALISQFSAFAFLPAWVVGILQGTQGIFAVVLSYIFIRSEERIDKSVIVSVVVVAAGVTLIGIQV